MSEPDEVEALSPEAKSFLGRHQDTGEPPAEGLERGRQRLAALGQGSTPVRPARRSWLPHEVLAAAAVVAIVVGVQVLYLVFRTPTPVEVKASTPLARVEPQGDDRELQAVLAAWRAGNLDGASELVSTACRSDACRPLVADLNSAVRLARRIDALSAEELDALGVLDLKLSGGEDSAVSKLIMGRKYALVAAPLTPGALSKAKAPAAEEPLEAATELRVAVGGSTELTVRGMARIAIGDPNIADVATIGGNKLRITGAAEGNTTLMVWTTEGGRNSMLIRVGPANVSVQKLFDQASRARASESWQRAFALAELVLKRDPTHAGARLIIDEARTRSRELYLRGYQLRETRPDEALRLFKDVLAMTPPDDETHQKAQSLVDELEGP